MNWKELVGSVAPTLGAALGGPFGGMAGKWLAGRLGSTEEDIEEVVLNSDPNLLAQIKELEFDFKKEMAALGIKEEQLHVQDRSDARGMAIKTTLLPQIILSTIFILGFVFVLYLVFTGDVDLNGTMKDVAIFLLGILSAGIAQIMNFFFGSSSGSKEKSAKLKK
ncbi:MAG: hypothetical protein R3254_00995 [Thiomicrorhabdus sp.]|nr:hypothetical protein [Thiomicrorhabdus sp.]